MAKDQSTPGYPVRTVFSDGGDEGISGAKDSRPALDRLMKDARRRSFDVVIVARFDRFARSVSHLLRSLWTGTECCHCALNIVPIAS